MQGSAFGKADGWLENLIVKVANDGEKGKELMRCVLVVSQYVTPCSR